MKEPMKMADGSKPPNFGSMIFDRTREAIATETEGMTMTEAAAHFNTSILFHEHEDGRHSAVGTTGDGGPLILINPNLREADQRKELLDSLTILALNNV